MNQIWHRISHVKTRRKSMDQRYSVSRPPVLSRRKLIERLEQLESENEKLRKKVPKNKVSKLKTIRKKKR